MRQSPEEISVGDYRQTLHEVWRVVRDRRWHFTLTFLIASTLALVGSLWIPRRYTATTVLCREQDPVLAGMMGKSWTEPYGEIRTRMDSDLTDGRMIEEVLEDLELPQDAAEPTSGERLAAARRSLAGTVARGMSVKSLQSSSTREVLSISLTMADPRHQPGILKAIRDHYVRATLARTSELLGGVLAFYLGEAARSRTRLAEVQKQMTDLEMEYPGIDPDAPDPTKQEEAAFVTERVEIEREIEEAQVRRAALDEQKLALCLEGETKPAPPVAPPPQVANPRHAALKEEIERVGREIDENRLVRYMTTQHPTNQRMMTMLTQKYAELDRTPAMIPANETGPSEGNDLATSLAIQQTLEAQIVELDARFVALHGRRAQIQARRTRLGDVASTVAIQRDGYLRLREKRTGLMNELNTWRSNIAPIEQLLKVENSNRALHYQTLREVEPSLKPSSPDARAAVGICLGVGAALGILVLVFAELTDRSFRTARGLAASVSVPVIESIDEIVTQAIRRRRLFRRLVLMPTVLGALVVATAFAGAVAYFSLERPRAYEAIRASPHRIYDVAFDEDADV